MPVPPASIELKHPMIEGSLGVWKIYFEADPSYVFKARRCALGHPRLKLLTENHIFSNQHLERALKMCIPPSIYNKVGMRSCFNIGLDLLVPLCVIAHAIFECTPFVASIWKALGRYCLTIHISTHIYIHMHAHTHLKLTPFMLGDSNKTLLLEDPLMCTIW